MPIDLSVFDAFEIHPCVLLDANGDPILTAEHEPCDADAAALFAYALYGHTAGQGVTALADFATAELAGQFKTLLDEIKQRRASAVVPVEDAFKQWWEAHKPRTPGAEETHVLMCLCAFRAGRESASGR